jgi:hypothetical protein
MRGERDVPLDIDRLYGQVEKMAVALPELVPAQQLADAQAFFRQADLGLLREKLRQREQGRAKIPWLVAEPVNTLQSVYGAPPVPPDLSVVASDGSSIFPDRHSPVRYYVVNIGYAVLTYGSVPNAVLDAQEQFCFEEEQLYFDPLDRRIPIEGSRLGIHMSVEELGGLLNAADDAPPPVVALRDGSMILWNLQSEDAAFQRHYLGRFLGVLDVFRAQGIPVASYISYPGGQDVMNCLRLILCDRTSGGCTRCPQENESQTLCRFMGEIRDRQLFNGLLRSGERSDVFESQSAILNQYKEHRIQFFYIDVGGEIARVEAPQWVMCDPEMLDLVHSTVYDQCQRSGQYPPYPPALIEAHEQAVISTAERRVVSELVEQALATQGIYYQRSAKDMSKRGRGV